DSRCERGEQQRDRIGDAGGGDSHGRAVDARASRVDAGDDCSDDPASMTSLRVALLAGDERRSGGAELIDAWEKDRSARLWVDIEDPDEATLEPLLEKRFGFHELASEDSLSANTLPKYDPFASYDFFIFRAVDVNLSEHGSQTYKLAAFLGRNFLFTVHQQTMRPVDNVCNRLPADRRLLGNGPDFLLYSIVDQMVDAIFPLLERIEEFVDALQETIFQDAR